MEKTNKYKKLFGRFIRFLTLALTFACLSCVQIEKSQDKMLVKDTIMSYNKLLIEAARTGDMEPLKGMVSEDVLKRLYHWLAAWEGSDLHMDATLKDIKFKTVNISKSSGDLAAKVLTAEDWIYEYRSLKTKEVVLPASGIHYEMEYILQKDNKKDDKWIIAQINIKSERKIQNAK